MRSVTVISLAAVLAGFAPGKAEIIDRVAVSVGNRAITGSEIDREIRITAFLDGVRPVITPETRRETAERLVQQKLVRREVELSRYPAPASPEAEPMMETVRARYGGEAAFQAALREYGITLEELRDHLLWRITFLGFVDTRFRRGVQVTSQEIEEYFEKNVNPAAQQANPGKPPDLEEYRDRIERTLEGQRADQELARWLAAARNRTEIEYREEAFR